MNRESRDTRIVYVDRTYSALFISLRKGNRQNNNSNKIVNMHLVYWNDDDDDKYTK